jgi:hypothetical protein
VSVEEGGKGGGRRREVGGEGVRSNLDHLALLKLSRTQGMIARTGHIVLQPQVESAVEVGKCLWKVTLALDPAGLATHKQVFHAG